MIFSSHRFGQLTRPADLILYVPLDRVKGRLATLELELNQKYVFTRYMNDSTVLECGTHNELMGIGGKYAELWNLQAQAFL